MARRIFSLHFMNGYRVPWYALQCIRHSSHLPISTTYGSLSEITSPVVICLSWVAEWQSCSTGFSEKAVIPLQLILPLSSFNCESRQPCPLVPRISYPIIRLSKDHWLWNAPYIEKRTISTLGSRFCFFLCYRLRVSSIWENGGCSIERKE